jgi:glycerophosphoryl diester phosphodiesterase
MNVIGHRGYPEKAPENTISSILEAAKVGCSTVEFDVMLTKDEVPILIHDDTLDRTTNGTGVVNTYLYSDIRALSAGIKFTSDNQYVNEKIPSLAEAIGVLVSQNLNANIEIKPCAYGDTSEKTAEIILNTLRAKWPKEKSSPLISSFDTKCLEYFQIHAPEEYPRAYLFSVWQDNCFEIAKNLGCTIATTNYLELTEDRVQKMMKAGLRVYAYTVNDMI